MANKTFVSNSTLTISDSNTEALGSSITGQEIVKIRSGITGVQLDANFERIDLSGTLASYKFVVVSGTGLQIQNVSNSAVVATIPNINQNVKIAFTDGSATLAQAGGTVFTLNSATLAVGATSAAATVSLAGGNVLNQAAGETSTVATTLVTTLATNATAFTGSIADSDMLDVGIFALTSAAVLSGGYGGLGAANTIAVKDGANISSGAITYFTDLLFDATGVSGTNDLTMTVAQHAGFTGVITAAGTGTNGEKITLTTIATGLSLFPSVENYVLGNFTNSVTQTAVGQAITGNADVDTVTAITGVTSTSDLAAGANVVIVPNGANISGGTFSATGGTVTLNLNGATTATLKAAQASETAISAATGTNNVTISDVMTGVTLDVDVETYTLANQANTVTLGTAAGSLAQNVVGGTSTDVLTLGAGAYTGTWTSISGLSLVTGNTSIAAVNNGTSAGAALAGSPTLLITGGGNATMTAAQYQSLGTITAAGTDTVTFSTAITGSATGVTDIESYVLAGSTTNAFTLDKAAETVTANAGADNINVIALPSANTILVGLAAADTITTATGANLSLAKYHATTAATAATGSAALVTGAGILVFAGTVTVSAAQLDGFTTLTGSATPNVIVNTAAVTAAMLDNTVISTTNTTITLGDFANAITSVDATVGAGNVLNVTAAAQGAGNALTFIGTLETNGTFSITGGAGSDAITGGSGSDTIVGSAGSDTITGGLGADTMTGGTGIDTFTITAADTAIDTILDWNSGAAQDVITTAYTAAGTLKITYASDSVAANALDLSTVLASFGVASVTGGASSDVITGGAGNDTIIGGGGSDTLIGGVGADSIVGGTSTDLITGGAGIDIINGGTGIDKFITGSVAADADEITGFVKATDILDLSAALTPVTLTIGTQVVHTTTKATNIAAVTTAANTDVEVYYIANTAGGAGVMSLTEIETAITAGSAATGQATIIIDNGTSTFIYTDQAAETDAGSGAGLILQATLIGITGATALATGDLISV